VGDRPITSAELESTIASSPFAVQFNTMSEDEQAALRGTLLQRLVFSRLLYLEARRLGLDGSEAFLSELEEFRQGLLYRSYMDALRAGIELPDEVRKQMKEQLNGNPDARKAAESAYRADRFRELALADLKRLRARYRVQVHAAEIRPDAAPETVLLEGEGLLITYADLLADSDVRPDQAEWIRDRLFKRAQFLLVTRAAAERDPDLEPALAAFREERLPALLLERKEREWIPDDQVLRDYFETHPDLGRILERRHIGQLVLATREEAEAMRERIQAGESLFALAGQHSIDPYGRAHKGDMGWVKAGRGVPAIEQAISGLPDGAVSAVIHSPMGFHLVTILERRPGEQRPFHRVRDKIRQTYLSERRSAYMSELAERYRVAWPVLDNPVSRN